jgi:small-conductance mechanosensitive channel
MAGTNTTTNSLVSKVIQNPHVASFWERTTPWEHTGIILGLAFAAHLIVKLIRHASEAFINKKHHQKFGFGFAQQPKFVTLTRLIVSAVTFVIYFLAVGLVLAVGFKLNPQIVATYFSSAAVIGLAVSFGLQGLIQDIVTGVTLILLSTMDVGDIVDLSGVIGRVERIGLRYTRLVTFFNQLILVPNRNIMNITRFPHGGILAYADVQIPAKADQQRAVETVHGVANGMAAQFGAIILSEPVFSSVEKTPGNWNYLRVRFQIWPGQNSLIETNFRQQMVMAMKSYDSAYADWQVVVTYRAMTSSNGK